MENSCDNVEQLDLVSDKVVDAEGDNGDLSRKLQLMAVNVNQACSGSLSPENQDNDNCANEDAVVVMSQVTGGGDDDALLLTDLPSEILIHIASFLNSRDVCASLYGTCKLFYELFSYETYWKTRIFQRWPKAYPIIEYDDFKWQKACAEREEVHKVWSNPSDYYHHIMIHEGFFAAVDVVHLMKRGKYLAVGSRDRHLNVMDLTKHDGDIPQQPVKDMMAFTDTKTHKGWIWSMASQDNTLVTGSWDTYIRLWDIGDGDVQFINHIKLKSAVLGIHYEPNFIAAGGFDKRLYMIDPRAPGEYTRKHYHSQPILTIAADDKYVISGSEDKTIAIYDRTAGKKYKQIQMGSFVNSMSYSNGQLWTGNKEGKLHVLDARDALFDETNMQTFDVGHNGRVTGLVHTDGGLFTCCTDSTIKIIEPNVDPSAINTLSSHSGEVARISYNNGVLASAGADISVGLWIPKNRAF